MLGDVVRNFIFLSLGVLFFFDLNAKITSLGSVPDWSQLEKFQKTITQNEFSQLLKNVYCPRSEWWSPWIKIDDLKAKIRKTAGSEDWYELHFIEIEDTPSEDLARSLPESMEGKIIALDPGHIGGEWSEMENRHFSLDGDPPVKEGDLTLAVAQILLPQLEALGVTPVLVRKVSQPVTQSRPEDFRKVAKQWAEEIISLENNDTQKRELLIKDREELLFYRVDEIGARAELINQSIKPDLVLCIHLNAAPWKDPEQKELVERNDHHVLVNGCYMGGELAYDDQRFDLIWRMLNRWSLPEQKLAESMSRAFSKLTGLAVFSYKGPHAIKIGEVPGVWARNLLANRKYRCPVIFLEPYVANSKATYPRLQKWIAGNRGGVDCLVKEYADAVLLGLKNYYSP